MRAALVQMDPVFGEIDSNLERIADLTHRAVVAGAELVVFPECAVTGYMVAGLKEGAALARAGWKPAVDRLEALARAHAVHLVAGLLEWEAGRLFNTCLLVGPGGTIARYRKTHVLCLGVDRFSTPGDIPYAVHDLPVGKLGMLICYDLRFPEAARSLALAGAQIIALPTNWPRSSTIMPEVFARARAAENGVFLLAADRVGTERGTTFLGRSVAVSPDGSVLAEAGMDHEEMLVVDLEPCAADRKHVVYQPGVHERDIFADRRPELYTVGS